MLAILHFVLVLLPLVLGNSLSAKRYSSNYKHVCEAIASAVSSESAVFYPGGRPSFPRGRSSSRLPQAARATRVIYSTGLSPVRKTQLVQLNPEIHMT